jgi:hypothetical protein
VYNQRVKRGGCNGVQLKGVGSFLNLRLGQDRPSSSLDASLAASGLWRSPRLQQRRSGDRKLISTPRNGFSTSYENHALITQTPPLYHIVSSTTNCKEDVQKYSGFFSLPPRPSDLHLSDTPTNSQLSHHLGARFYYTKTFCCPRAAGSCPSPLSACTNCCSTASFLQHAMASY